MSGELERYEAPLVETTLDLPWWELLPKVAQIVDVVVRTPFVGGGLRGNTAAATAAVMYGHELGLGPMTSLNKLNVIDGAVSPSAELARALAMRAGEVWVEDESDERVTVAARRHGSDVVHRVTWTMGDARRAGLTNKHNWKTYPRAMLYARASAEIVRRVFPDVLGGITLVAEELDDERTAEQTTQQPDRAPVRRAKRAAALPHRASMSDAADESARIDAERAPRAPLGAAESEDAQADVEAHEAPTDAQSEPDDEPQQLDAADVLPMPRERRLTAPSTGGRAPSTSQLTALRTLVRRLELADDSQRAGKLELISSIVERQVQSTNDLDAREASLVLDAFQAMLDGTARIGVADDGSLCLVKVQQP